MPKETGETLSETWENVREDGQKQVENCRKGFHFHFIKKSLTVIFSVVFIY